jgi:hypothetical protein
MEFGTQSCFNVFIGTDTGATFSSSFCHSIALGHCACITSNNQLSVASVQSPIGTASTATDFGTTLCNPAFWLCVTVNGVNGKIPIFGV